jgi:protein-tyrosine-phosphatase
MAMMPSEYPEMVMPRRVLFVCTANICRSPAAEYLARHFVSEQDYAFRSAGFMYDGYPITQKMAQAIERFGVTDALQHSSHIIDYDTLEAAELILTMESRHLRDLTVRDRSVFDKTIPFKEAVTLLDRPMSLDEFLASIADRQASNYFDQRWDVEDPYKRSMKKYRAASEEIKDLVTDLFTNLKP